MKFCTRCCAEKPVSDFGPAQKTKDRLNPWCKPCNVIYTREYLAANPDKRSARLRAERSWALQKKYGITIEQYEEMLEAQGGVCALCHDECVSGRRLAVDHDHVTMRVRGLLCGRCNRAIGLFKDNVDALRRAAEYLAK